MKVSIVYDKYVMKINFVNLFFLFTVYQQKYMLCAFLSFHFDFFSRYKYLVHGIFTLVILFITNKYCSKVGQ